MTKLFVRWFQRNFSDPQAVVLVMILLLCTLVVLTLSDLLAPIFVAIVLAYLLEWLVAGLQKTRLPRLASVLLVFVGFIGLSALTVFVFVPLVWQQTLNLFSELPTMVTKTQEALLQLPEKYPGWVNSEQVTELMSYMTAEAKTFGQQALSVSFSSLFNLAALIVYIILVPLLVFFFLKDKHLILKWFQRWLPQERRLVKRVWSEVNQQIGNYIRGKVVEIVIVGAASIITFAVLGLPYALLLGMLVGFSVLIPYIGAAAVTLPVALVAYFHWGFSSEFTYLMVAYLIIQALDGNVLVPVLFSEAVNLHPVAIIAAVLLFGGIWGFWGVFFAIPLATVIKAVLDAWSEVQLAHAEAQKTEVVTSDAA